MFNVKEEAYFLTLEQERRAALAQDKQKPVPEKQFNETTAVFLRRLGLQQKRR